MEEIIKLLEQNKELLETIVKNQRKIENLISESPNSLVADVPTDPFTKLNRYFEQNKTGNLKWSVGSSERKALEVTKSIINPRLWIDADCDFLNQDMIKETFRKMGFNLYDGNKDSGYSTHDKIFIYAS